MQKRTLSIFFTILLLCTMSITVMAHDVPDLDASGSITVNIVDDGQKITSGTLTFYRIGEICEDDGNYDFQLTGDFSSCGESLQDVYSPELAQKLMDFANQNKISGETVQIENGTAVYSIPKGQLGLYLVVQYQASTGYDMLHPFLISVPNLEDGEYVYDVNATPKMGEIVPSVPTTPTTPPTTDTDVPSLPQTGQMKWPVPVLTALGLCLFAVGWILRFKSKKEET